MLFYFIVQFLASLLNTELATSSYFDEMNKRSRPLHSFYVPGYEFEKKVYSIGSLILLNELNCQVQYSIHPYAINKQAIIEKQ